MADLMIHDVPDELCREFASIPAAERWAIEQEMIEDLENRIHAWQAPWCGVKVEQIRAFRESLGNIWLTPEFIEEAINEGRP